MEYVFEMDDAGNGMDRATWGDMTTTSKNGASCALARKIVATGAEDGTVALTRAGRVVMNINSLHGWATQSYSEGAAARLSRVKYREFDKSAMSS